MCFGKKAIGLDIADRSIEVALVKSSWGKYRVASLGRVVLEEGIVEGGRIKNQDKLIEAVTRVFKEAKSKAITGGEIVFGLPERQVYTHYFNLPIHNRKDREKLILEELINNLPISEKNITYSYRIKKESKDGVEVLAVAAAKEVVSEWTQFFKKIKLSVNTFDVEVLAIARDLFDQTPAQPVLVVDIGSRTSLLAIFDADGLCYEQVVARAGDAITTAIATATEIDNNKAEVEKIKSGLKSRNKDIVSTIQKELDVISAEIKDTVAYFEKNTGKKISSAVFVGGTSQLIGLIEYFSDQLKLPVSIGVSQLNKQKSPLEYIEAIGLALRALDSSWRTKDPEIKIN